MIIGNGDIASILNDRNGVCFFASGVSDSSCVDPKQFARERRKLMMIPAEREMLVYFSSISAMTKKTPYFEHKKTMENMVRRHFINHCIIRIGNINWGDNPNTFVNFLKNKKLNGESFEVFQEHRFLITKKQLLFITDNLPLTGQHEISVFGQMVWLPDFINTL